jgi:hypothetical protein
MNLFNKISAASSSVPSSIEELARTLSNKTSNFLWSHQSKVCEEYEKFKNVADVSLELPTGSGKTLVGLLIAEFQRRSNKYKVVYLCPTKQLAEQVYKQSQAYGIQTILCTGSKNTFENTPEFFSYERAEKIAITTYSGLFNTAPAFPNPDLILCDDAHSTDNSIASLWTVSINKGKSLFTDLINLLGDRLSENLRYAISRQNRASDKIEMLGYAQLHDKYTEIRKCIDDYFDDNPKDGARFPWTMLQEKLNSCFFYCSANLVEIRPLIPPTLSHQPFAQAKQRVYMSATPGTNGDLERALGVKTITRIVVPKSLEKVGIGRKLILFPGCFLKEDDEQYAPLINSVRKSGKGVVLVNNDRAKDKVKEKISSFDPKLRILDDVDKDLQDFKSFQPSRETDPLLLIVSRRYDGMDFPNEECRVLAVIGHPVGGGLQEDFLMSMLNAQSQMGEKIRTRIVQSLGRCVRGSKDTSIVYILGKDLLRWFCEMKNTRILHPDLQAEIAFGLTYSTNTNIQNFNQIADCFLERSNDWQAAENEIATLRDSRSRDNDPVASALSSCVKDEVNFATYLWNGDYEKAFESVIKVIDSLEGNSNTNQELRPYRAFWHYLACHNAYLLWHTKQEDCYKQKALEQIQKAKTACSNIPAESIYKNLKEDVSKIPVQSVISTERFNVVNKVITELGLQGNKLETKLHDVFSQLNSKDDTQFEMGLEFLGRMLGARTKRWSKSDTGKPDGFWSFDDGDLNVVFEAKLAKTNEALSISDVTQAGRHSTTVKADGEVREEQTCYQIIIANNSNVDGNAKPHCNDLYFISLADALTLFSKVKAVITTLRNLAVQKSLEGLEEEFQKQFTPFSTESLKGLLLKLPSK